MRIFVFVGPPGAGKGTQCALMASRLGYTHISTGDMIRKEISSNSILGKRIKYIVDNGNLVDDETVIDCLVHQMSILDASSSDVVLWDGVPRNLVQAKKLDEKYGLSIVSALNISAPLDSLLDRFLRRWTCSKCGKVSSFSLDFKSEGFICQKCSAVSSYFKRNDDSFEVVKSRFEIYKFQTTPILDYYKSKNILVEFDALQPIEKIYRAVSDYIEKKLAN